MTNILGIAILVLLTAGIISLVVSAYNKLVMLKFNIEKAFANIDVLLKQRADEIPNLVTVVKENMRYEEGTLEKLTLLRTQYNQAQRMEEKVQLSNEITKSMKGWMAVAENYPTLQATQSFLELRMRVSDLEDRIADRREFFNESVNLYNIGIHEFPQVLLAKMMGYHDKPLLQITEEEKHYDGVTF